MCSHQKTLVLEAPQNSHSGQKLILRVEKKCWKDHKEVRNLLVFEIGLGAVLLLFILTDPGGQRSNLTSKATYTKVKMTHHIMPEPQSSLFFSILSSTLFGF